MLAKLACSLAARRVLCDAAVLSVRDSRWEQAEPTPFSRCAHSGIALPGPAPQQAQQVHAAPGAANGSHTADASHAPSTSSSSGGGSGGCCAVLIYGGYSGARRQA